VSVRSHNHTRRVAQGFYVRHVGQQVKYVTLMGAPSDIPRANSRKNFEVGKTENCNININIGEQEKT
jgi:hypothetical protein